MAWASLNVWSAVEWHWRTWGGHWTLPVALNHPHSPPEALACMARPMPCSDTQPAATGSLAKLPVPPLLPGSGLHTGLSSRVASPGSGDDGPLPMAAQFPQQPVTPGGIGMMWMSLVLLVWILMLNGTWGTSSSGSMWDCRAECLGQPKPLW